MTENDMPGSGTTEPHPAGRRPPERFLPDATRVGRVSLQVADLARSLAFYGEVLGLRPLRRDAGSVELGVPGSDRALVELRERPGARPAPPRGRLGLYHFALLLPERAALGAFVRHLAERGVRVGASDHLVSEALYLQDPDGLGVEVYADRPRSAWRSRGGELVMHSLPLDLADLARAARTPWTGAPAGTTVGHLHLHVGDLAEADRFYHRTLGLQRMVWSYPGALFLAAGGYHHHLGLNTWAGAAPAAGEDDARLLEWELLLPDAAAVEDVGERMREGGRAASVEAEWVRVEDPWGTVLKVRVGESS